MIDLTRTDTWRSWKYDPPVEDEQAYILCDVHGKLLSNDAPESEAYCWRQVTRPTYEELEAVHAAEADRVKRSMDGELELSCPVCGEITHARAANGELWFTCADCGSKCHVKYEVSI